MYSVLEHFDIVYSDFGFLFKSSFVYFLVFCSFFFLIIFSLNMMSFKLLGDGFQLVLELICNFVGGLSNKLSVGTSNRKMKRILNLWIFLVFGEILILNLLALIPGGLSLTSFWTVSFFFAMVVWVQAVLMRVYFKEWRYVELFVPAVKAVILFILVLIEFVSYLLRIISLHVRLMANILAGHALVGVLCGLIYVSIGSFIQLPLIIVTVCIVLLELLVACIQAYIFLMLMVLYLSDFLY